MQKATRKTAKKATGSKAKKPAARKRKATVTAKSKTKSKALGARGKSKKSASKTKASAKTHHKGRTKTRAPQPIGSNVIWKFLEMKEARRKAAQEAQRETGTGGGKHANGGGWGSQTDSRHDGFSRFSGPRRRAA